MVRKGIVILASLFSVLLVVSVVFVSGLVDVSILSFISPGSNSTAEVTSTASVFVDPAALIQDYAALPIGSKFTVHVNVSGVTDLFSWQINLTWNKAILNLSRISTGEFLLRTASVSKTAAYQLGCVINRTDNANGFTGMGESILGGVPGISGDGRLVSIEFLIVGYGSSNLTISLAGNLATTLLSSTGNSLTFTATDGYFRNALSGDANIDKTVNVFDILAVKSRWGTTPASPNWVREYDVNLDDAINVFDILTVKANWGRTAP